MTKISQNIAQKPDIATMVPGIGVRMRAMQALRPPLR
jgi:hypothetical protein